MEIFKCKYLTHENEEILGFCLNEDCKNATQYCYQCLTMTHSDHQRDCIRFVTMSQDIKQLIQFYNQQSKQIKEIIGQLKNVLDEFQKKIDQEIKTFNNMDLQLKKQDFLTLKSQINIIKKIYSKENQKEIQQQIIELNKILNTIKNMVQVQTQVNVQVNSGIQKSIKIVEITEEDEVYMQFSAQQLFDEGQQLANRGEFQEALIKFDDSIKLFSQDFDVYVWKGYALNSLSRYQESIECCENAISINRKNDQAWNNKGYALNSLSKFKEAIDCFDKALLINNKNDMAWNNKGFALNNLSRYKEAIECCDKAISINPNNNFALINGGFALHQIQQYQKAIFYYDKALSICANPQILEFKSDSSAKLYSAKSNTRAKSIGTFSKI